MGYDCTLHLVDERAIREEFVPRLLGLTTKETALDRVLKDAPKLWEIVRRSLKEKDPQTAASFVCQLAVKFSACSLPHQYERGLALCLWEDQGDLAVEYPRRLAFSPEPLFTAVVERYPSLHGQFPNWFTGNYSTGVFIPSERVREVLDWVEGKVKQFGKGEQRHFRGLLGILRAAAEKHLAYWEATDIVGPIKSETTGTPRLMMADFLRNERSAPTRGLERSPVGMDASLATSDIVDHWLVVHEDNPFGTTFIDLSVWPPRLVSKLEEFAPYHGRSQDGRWLLLSETDPEATPRTFRPRMLMDVTRPQSTTLPKVKDGRREVAIRGGGFVGGRAMVFRDVPDKAKAGDVLPPPLWLDGEQWKPMPGLPKAIAGAGFSPYLNGPAAGIVQLADRTDVVIWDDGGYEFQGGRFEKTFALGPAKWGPRWTFVPAGSDGFFYLSKRCLFEVHRGGPVVSHAPKWTNIIFIRPGPAGSILIQEGDNKDDDIGKLYFPADRTFIHIEPECFDDNEYEFIYWSESDRFIVLYSDFLAIRTCAVLSLPRHDALTGRRVKA
jgi:hypothetical protein